jgi:hypothetical protein
MSGKIRFVIYRWKNTVVFYKIAIYFSLTVRDILNNTTMSEGQVEKDLMSDLQALLTWILWIFFTCMDT